MEAFFKDTTVVDLVQRSIEEVDALETKEQKKLLRTFRNVRQELQDRLLVIPEGTFTEQQLNITLVQVQAGIEAIKRDLKGQLNDSAEVLSTKGVQDLIKQITRMSKKFEGVEQPLNFNAIVAAQTTQRFLLNKYESSVEAYGESLRSQIVSNITQSMVTRDNTDRTVARLRSDIGKFFLGEEWKLNRIARTELHNIYNVSKLQGMQDTKEQDIPDLMKAMMHPMDNRTGEDSKQLAEQNPIVPLDEPFVQKYRGKTFRFMGPPSRPNDRAVLVPYRKEWGKQASKFTPN